MYLDVTEERYNVREADNKVCIVVSTHHYGLSGQTYYTSVRTLTGWEGGGEGRPVWVHVDGSASGHNGKDDALERARRLYDGGWKDHATEEFCARNKIPRSPSGRDLPPNNWMAL